MSRQLSENQKHVRRRLEPLRMTTGSQNATVVRRPGSSRIRVSAVEALGVRYHGGTFVDSDMDWTCGGKKPYLANRFVEDVIRLSQLRHPNVVVLYGVVTDGPSVTLVTDLPAASLDECLRRYDVIPEFVKVSVLLDSARGLLYLHSQKPAIAHTRLSTRSIFLSPSSMRAKIGDVGVAGALAASVNGDSDGGGALDERIPSKRFVEILETGTKRTDVHVDVPAFGNVVVHTACQQPWLDPPGHTSLSPHLQTMFTNRHPLYSLAYHCLLGGVQLSLQQEVPPVGIDYAVQFLQKTADKNPPPYPDTVELYQKISEIHGNQRNEQRMTPSPLPRENGIPDSHNFTGNDSHLPSCGQKICNETTKLHNPSISPTFKSLLPPVVPSDILRHPAPISDKIHPNSHSTVLLYTPSTDGSRRNSTGQLKVPPPKPPQRTSSFKRKPVDSGGNDLPLQRSGSLRVRSQPPPETREQQQPPQSHNLQQPGSPSKVPASGGSKHSLQSLLPSKFTRGLRPPSRSQQPEMNDSTATDIVQPPPVTVSQPPQSVSRSFAEFETLLARQREKVEADETSRSQMIGSSWHPTSNGPVTHHQNFQSAENNMTRTAATDLDLPKKKAPPPPRRSSSFRSKRRYEGQSVTRQTLTPVAYGGLHDSGKSGGYLSPPSTSPSTGQSRPTSAEYHLRRLSGGELSETVFS